MKACCITGVSEIPSGKLDYVKRELRREIMLAVEEGYKYFISGFNDGVELEFAAIVAEIKENKPEIFLEAAFAHPGKLRGRSNRFQDLLKKVNGIKPVSDEEGPDCDFVLNRYLVGESMRVIAVFDGDGESNAAQTIRMSAATERELKMIEI